MKLYATEAKKNGRLCMGTFTIRSRVSVKGYAKAHPRFMDDAPGAVALNLRKRMVDSEPNESKQRKNGAECGEMERVDPENPIETSHTLSNQ